MRELASVLASDYGVDTSGWTLLSATAISPDGLTIVGQASHPQLGGNVAYRVVLPEPSGALAACALLGCLLRRRRTSRRLECPTQRVPARSWTPAPSRQL